MSTRPTLTTTAATSSPSSFMPMPTKLPIQIVGGEQYILSAVMHADEINLAMTEALGQECTTTTFMWSISLWWKSKSCGRSAARTRRWSARSRRPSCRSAGARSGHPSPLLDEAGKPVLNAKGKSPEEVVQRPAGRFLQLYAQRRVHGCGAR